MTPFILSRRQKVGFTLIEMLVVLAIVGILSLVGLQSFVPRSPRAVRAALLDLRGALQLARQLAMSNGKDISFVITAPGRLRAFESKSDGTADMTKPPLMDTIIGSNLGKVAELTGQDPIVTDSTIQAIEALKTTLGFKDWTHPLDFSDSAFGFSASGLPQIIAGGVRSPAPFWFGARGLRINQKGVPYGAVVVTEQGIIVAYYKADSGLDDPKEFKWQRLD